MDDEKFQLRFQHKNMVTNICKYKFNIVKISSGIFHVTKVGVTILQTNLL